MRLVLTGVAAALVVVVLVVVLDSVALGGKGVLLEGLLLGQKILSSQRLLELLRENILR